MKVVFALGTRRQRLASFTLASVFFLSILFWFVLFALFLTLQLRWKVDAAVWGSIGSGVALLMSVAGLRRTIKNGHFIWLYGRWRLGEAFTTPIAQQAQQAFADGDFERVILLARKAESKGSSESSNESLQAGLGKALALLGRLDEATEVLELCPSEQEGLRWLKPRRAWGMEWPTYFHVDDVRWLKRGYWLGLLMALSVGGMVWSVWWIQSRPGEMVHAFNVSGFETVQQGAFTIHYHDPQFRDRVLDLAEKALFKELDFFEHADADIPKGTFQLYLCNDRAEYLRRAPYSPSWEEASALPQSNRIYLYEPSKDDSIYFEVVVAHELSHLLYNRFFQVKFNDAWLNEGLADYLGYAFGLDRAGYARQDWLDKHRFKALAAKSIPFDHFFEIDPHDLKTDDEVRIFYRQGFSVVFMLVEHFGRADFLRFLNAYRDSAGNASIALAKVYPTIPDTEALAGLWGLYFGKSAN